MTYPFIRSPWDATLTSPEHTLIYYFLLLAGLAFVVGLIRTMVSSPEVGTRYRTATIARLGVMASAAISYLVIIVSFGSGYALRHGVYVPRADAVLSFAPRYVEWSVTVPLLVIELLAVCVIAGQRLRRTRAIASISALLMVFTGFLGVFVVDDGRSLQAVIVFGAVSCIFWGFSTFVLIRAVRASLASLTPESGRLLGHAATVLLCGWIIYPVIYVIQVTTFGGRWATAIQILLSLADVAVKLGFAGIVHRIAKLRTAEDVRAGNDVHAESIWISSIKQSDAGNAREVNLAPGASVHSPRSRPPTNYAVPTDLDDGDYEEPPLR